MLYIIREPVKIFSEVPESDLARKHLSPSRKIG